MDAPRIHSGLIVSLLGLQAAACAARLGVFEAAAGDGGAGGGASVELSGGDSGRPGTDAERSLGDAAGADAVPSSGGARSVDAGETSGGVKSADAATTTGGARQQIDPLGSAGSGGRNDGPPTEAFCFAPVLNAEPLAQYTSDEIVVDGLGTTERGEARLYAAHEEVGCTGGFIVKNDITIEKEDESFVSLAVPVVNGDRLRIGITRNLGAYNACRLTVGNETGIFAATSYPYQGVPADQGSAGSPVPFSELEPGVYGAEGLGHVGRTASYFVLRRSELEDESLYLYVDQTTANVDFYLYDNAGFEGQPFCSSEQADVRQYQYCELGDVDPVYVKVENASACDGASFALEPAI